MRPYIVVNGQKRLKVYGYLDLDHTVPNINCSKLISYTTKYSNPTFVFCKTHLLMNVAKIAFGGSTCQCF